MNFTNGTDGESQSWSLDAHNIYHIRWRHDISYVEMMMEIDGGKVVLLKVHVCAQLQA